MSQKRIMLITLGVMLSLFMASMESTVVATAMPTIVSQLGGLRSYSWVFAAYLLTSTTTVPIYGKLSDLYGRRPVYAFAMCLFLAGSFLCGRSGSMTQLIAFRAVQGIGAGGLQPLAFIIIADLFTFAQRTKMQGLFSGVWGFSSIVGPLMGGFLVDQVSWHWVFYINLLPGLLAMLLVVLAWQDPQQKANAERQPVDYAGALLMTATVTTLLLGLFELGTTTSALLIGLSIVLAIGLIVLERRAADPIIPLRLFRDRIFSVACGQGVLSGWALFGSASYVPLFVQAVLGTSATAAGATLTPQLLGWVGASIIGSRLLLRLPYRNLAITGMVLLVVGTFLLSRIGVNANRLVLMFDLGLMGVGMGLSIPSFLVAVQSSVRRADMGAATAAIQFSRNIGSTLGVSVMGAVLSIRLAQSLAAAHLNDTGISVSTLLDPVAAGNANVTIEGSLRTALATAISGVFVLGLVVAVLGLVVTVFAPRGQISQLEARRSASEEESSQHYQFEESSLG